MLGLEVQSPNLILHPYLTCALCCLQHGMVPRAAAQGGTAASSRGPFQAREFLRGLGLLIHDNGKEAPAPKLATVPGELCSPAAVPRRQRRWLRLRAGG